jgi:ribonuclease R
VNQRILLAVLRDDSLPYSRAALEEIAASINRREQEAREASRAHFLSLYDRRVGALVAAATRDPSAEISALARLDARKFHSVLRIAAEGQALFPPVEQEILRRLEAQQLYAHDLFTLLFRFPTRGTDWERVKTAALGQLQRTPEYASNLLLMGANALAWSTPTYETIPALEEFAPRFRARATITRAGQQYASAWQSAPQKQRAKHLAATNLLLQLAGGAQQAEPLAGEDRSVASAPDDGSRQPTSAPASPHPGDPARHNYRGSRKTPAFRHGDISDLAAVDMNV